jgi:hypothetical protein
MPARSFFEPQPDARPFGGPDGRRRASSRRKQRPETNRRCRGRRARRGLPRLLDREQAYLT